MLVLEIIETITLICLLIVGVATMILFHKNSKKMSNKVKDALIKRFSIITVLTVLIFILNFIMVFLGK